ncbi:hypothetical protein ElyMa_004721500 [Elysia marginata]|uniref:Uncharacterized protein n=1 Tax=Elysia marginata TaxID=1093978 RepID=A0AAV4I9S6_9GAST|nr:hypothetical protein ElyMa_004721500 [Elysia marginata]
MLMWGNFIVAPLRDKKKKRSWEKKKNKEEKEEEKLDKKAYTGNTGNELNQTPPEDLIDLDSFGFRWNDLNVT